MPLVPPVFDSQGEPSVSSYAGLGRTEEGSTATTMAFHMADEQRIRAWDRFWRWLGRIFDFIGF